MRLGLIQRTPVLIQLAIILSQVGAIPGDILLVTLDVLIILAKIGTVATDITPILANVPLVLPQLLIVLRTRGRHYR